MAAQGNSSEQRLGLGKDALSNILLEKIMSDALVEHDGKVSIGDRTITCLQVSDHVAALASRKSRPRGYRKNHAQLS